MSSPRAAAFVALMFALGAALDRSSRAVLKELPLPWLVATLHFGAGLLWIFPAWTIGMRQTPRLTETQKKRVAPLAFLHATGHLCMLGVLGTGSLAITHVFQATEPVMVSAMSWAAGEESGQQHLVSWLALLLLMAGVLVTFREASFFVCGRSALLENPGVVKAADRGSSILSILFQEFVLGAR